MPTYGSTQTKFKNELAHYLMAFRKSSLNSVANFESLLDIHFAFPRFFADIHRQRQHVHSGAEGGEPTHYCPEDPVRSIQWASAHRVYEGRSLWVPLER